MKSFRTLGLASTCLLAVGVSAIAATPAVAATTRIAGPLVLADGAGSFVPITTPTTGPRGIAAGAPSASVSEATAAAARFSLPRVGETGLVRAADRCLTHVPDVRLVSCNADDPRQAYETFQTGGELNIRLAGFPDAVLGASSQGLSFVEKGTAGFAQAGVADNFQPDEAIEPPEAGPRLEDVFAFDTAGAAIVGGKAGAGTTVTVQLDGTTVATTTIGSRDTRGLFGLIARGVAPLDELVVTATSKDGRVSSTKTVVQRHDSGPVSTESAKLGDGSVAITGRGTPGADIVVSGLIEPDAVKGDAVVAPDGTYSVKATLSTRTARAMAEVLVKVTETSASGTFDAYVRVAGADDLVYAVPSVFAAPSLDGADRLLGFVADADGYLSATPSGDYDDAARGATTLVYSFGTPNAAITDEAGEKCLTLPLRSAADQRPRLLDCTGESDQEWTMTEDGTIQDVNADRGLVPVAGATPGSWTLQVSGAAGRWMTIVAPQVFSEPLRAKADLSDGSLHLAGTATPLSEIVVTATINGLTQELTGRSVDETGAWSAVVPGAVLRQVPDARVTVTDRYLSQTQVLEFDLDAKNVVTIADLTDGDVIVGGSTSISGTALRGLKVRVLEGDEVLGEVEAEPAAARAAGDEGTFAVPVSGLTPGEHTLTVEQRQNDNATTRSSVTVEVQDGIAPPVVDSPAADSTVTVSRPVFTGTGEPKSTVAISYGPKSKIGSATVKEDGTWSASLTAGLSLGKSTLTVTQTAGADKQTVTHAVTRVLEAADLAVTSHTTGDTYADGIATFSGTGAEGATVTAKNQWGTPMGSATVKNGVWTFARNLGPTSAGYDIVFTQTLKGTEAKTVSLHLDYEKQANVPVTVTSIADGATYTPGMNILRGTGTPGATVAAVNATNNWNVPMGTAKVAAGGSWALPERNWGPSNDYEIKVTQTNPDKTTSTATVIVKAPSAN
ncbi:Ig-like domain-containing protein [Frondihabitans sp. PhB188]|uniref:Ig-like domain-containing protein n=1 Tax=Frondihabitans sp. PhB188 TaxID=2485200 RepID=UPI000F4634E8|nr:Ig-like domain-containing protein [Frondihabitans sp. PhB188]